MTQDLKSGSLTFQAQDRLIYGQPAGEAVAALAQSYGANHVFLITSASGEHNPVTGAIREALAERYAGVFHGCEPHSPRANVIDGARAASNAQADLLVALGGGSVIDAAKVMQLALWQGLSEPEALEPFHSGKVTDPQSILPSGGVPAIRSIAVPTTLSGAEFTPFAGVTDSELGVKQAYDHPLFVPRAVVYDPRAAQSAPSWVLLSTGIRAVDHCVETFCSTGATAYSDATAIHGLRLLAKGLVQLKKQPDDLANLLDCQMAAWLAISGPASGVPVGVSHAIGRVLGGACGVPHGQTSCIMLPASLRWNAQDAQAEVRQFELLQAAGLTQYENLHTAVAELVKTLGEPGTLTDAGVDQSSFDRLAENSLAMLKHPSVAGNPRAVRTKEDIYEILELAR